MHAWLKYGAIAVMAYLCGFALMRIVYDTRRPEGRFVVFTDYLIDDAAWAVFYPLIYLDWRLLGSEYAHFDTVERELDIHPLGERR